MFCKAAQRCPATPVLRTTLPAKDKGFTLVELMVTLAVAFVLAVLAVPDLTDFSAQNSIRLEADALADSLKTARSEAIRSNTTVSVCASDLNTGVSSNVSSPACSTNPNSNWSNGWVVFVDPAFSRSVPNTNSIRNLRVPTSSQISVTPAGVTIPDDSGGSTLSNVLSFQPNGESYSGTATFTLSVTTASGRTFSITVEVHPSGQIITNPLVRT